MEEMGLFAQRGGQARKEDVLAAIRKAKNASKPQRMAGEELSNAANEILMELRGEREDEIIQEAMDDLFSLREIDKDINSRWDDARALTSLRPDDLGDPQLVGSISPSVPEAVVVEYDKGTFGGLPVRNETRLHTKYEQNPVTGQLDVVPFVAKGESKPLITEFGLVDDGLGRGATEGMHSDEFLGKRILQLMGQEPVANNNQRVTAVDLMDQTSGKGVDVEILKTGDLNRGNGVGMQVYTQIAPANSVPTQVRSLQESRDVARSMAQALDPLLRGKMRRENLTVVEAVDALAREGKVSNAYGNGAPYGGKLLKEGGAYADKIVYPVFTNEEAKQNLRTSSRTQPRGLQQPLSGAYLLDVPTVQDRVRNNRGRGAAAELSVRPLPGNDGRTPAGKVYVQLPTEGTEGLHNLGDKAAAVRQLFRQQRR